VGRRIDAEEALKLGGEGDGGEFVGHDQFFAASGGFPTETEVARGGDFRERCVNDAGEIIEEMVKVGGDVLGGVVLQRLDASEDGRFFEETVAADGGSVASGLPVDAGVGLSGALAGSDDLGEGFVAGLGRGATGAGWWSNGVLECWRDSAPASSGLGKGD